MTGDGLVFHDLTVPDDGARSVRRLLSQYLGRQYRDLVKLRPPTQGHEAQALAILQRYCHGLAASSPGPLFAALQRSSVGGMVRLLAGGGMASPQAGAWVTTLAATLYAELALNAAAPPPIVLVPAPPRIIVSGAGASVRCPDGTATVRLHGEGLTFAGSTGATILKWDDVREHRSPLVDASHLALRGRCRLALADDNPLADFETHPDKSGSGLDLGGRSPADWLSALNEALALVRAGLPALADEMELLIDQLVPVGYDRERHLSASYAEFVGTIYLSLHPDVLTLAEALIHEHSHNKINMLWTLSPVLDNGFAPLYSSPFRPDPRPLHGVLLGVHAFIPVERLYEQLTAHGHPIMATRGIEERRRLVRERNAAACEMLAQHAQASPVGRAVLDDISRWNAHFS